MALLWQENFEEGRHSQRLLDPCTDHHCVTACVAAATAPCSPTDLVGCCNVDRAGSDSWWRDLFYEFLIRVHVVLQSNLVHQMQQGLRSLISIYAIILSIADFQLFLHLPLVQSPFVAACLSHPLRTTRAPFHALLPIVGLQAHTSPTGSCLHSKSIEKRG